MCFLSYMPCNSLLRTPWLVYAGPLSEKRTKTMPPTVSASEKRSCIKTRVWDSRMKPPERSRIETISQLSLSMATPV